MEYTKLTGIRLTAYRTDMRSRATARRVQSATRQGRDALRKSVCTSVTSIGVGPTQPTGRLLVTRSPIAGGDFGRVGLPLSILGGVGGGVSNDPAYPIGGKWSISPPAFRPVIGAIASNRLAMANRTFLRIAPTHVKLPLDHGAVMAGARISTPILRFVTVADARKLPSANRVCQVTLCAFDVCGPLRVHLDTLVYHSFPRHISGPRRAQREGVLVTRSVMAEGHCARHAVLAYLLPGNADLTNKPWTVLASKKTPTQPQWIPPIEKVGLSDGNSTPSHATGKGVCW
jgi:hypothetical protein